MGNHEQMMLDVIRHGDPHHAWLRYGGVETLESYGFTGDLDFLPPDHERFFDSLGDYFEFDDYIFMHAAYDPMLPLDQQTTEMLRWYSLTQGIPGPAPAAERRRSLVTRPIEKAKFWTLDICFASTPTATAVAG